nr:hypothetical protein OG999_47275 [Streptomyces sp. NBC_00886]
MGSPGLIYMGCCTLIGASITLLPAAADAAWGPAAGFLVIGVGWLVARSREPGNRHRTDGAVALAGLGVLILSMRISGMLFWQGLSLSAAVLGTTLGQAAALALMVLVLTGTGVRTLQKAGATSLHHPAP